MPKRDDHVRVRIAPSPTGRAHIATVRAALVNYVFAKQHNGAFLLRIEDTDQARSKPEFDQDIRDQLTWLGLPWDEEPYRQSARLNLYRQKAKELQDKGLAYIKDGAIYFKVDPNGPDVVFTDLVKGEVKFPRKEIPDFVIVRSDGIPVYHFTVVVDDMEMEISHVIRGEDHLSNTPKHILLFQAFDAQLPEFGHLPIILGPDGGKMSKRHGSVSIYDYRRQGYLPEALINFVALLGWSPLAGQALAGQAGEDEIIDIKKMITMFHLDAVSHHGAIFDKAKLDFLNGYYIRHLKLGDLAERIAEWTKYVGKEPPKQDGRLLNVLATVQERMKRLDEFPALTAFYFAAPTYKADLLVFKKSDKEKTKLGLSKALEALQVLKTWSRDDIQSTLESVVAANELGNGDVFWPVRVAATGSEASPPPVEVLLVLGKDESIARIRKALEMLRAGK